MCTLLKFTEHPFVLKFHCFVLSSSCVTVCGGEVVWCVGVGVGVCVGCGVAYEGVCVGGYGGGCLGYFLRGAGEILCLGFNSL